MRSSRSRMHANGRSSTCQSVALTDREALVAQAEDRSGVGLEHGGEAVAGDLSALEAIGAAR